MRKRLESGKASFGRVFGVGYRVEEENNVGATNSINDLDATEHLEHWDIKRVALIIRVA